jgi:hypothetical protein
VHDSPARHRVIAAGRRIGKSLAGGHELLAEAYRTRMLLPRLDPGKRREFWIVGPEYTDAEKEFRVLYDALRALDAPLDRPGTYYDAHDGVMQVSLYGGRFLVLGKSAKHLERLVGEGLTGVIMTAAAKQRERSWTKYVRPMLADQRGWSLHTFTPEGKNWFYALWMRGQSSVDPEWASWRLPSWMNSYIYPRGEDDPEIRAMRRDMSRETFGQEVEELFTEFVGRAFKEFNEETHVRDLSYTPGWRTFAAVDYGFTNPFVWLLVQVDEFDNVYVIDELYEPGLTIDEAADSVLDRGLAPPALRAFHPDPASPGDSRALEARLHVRAQGGTGGELEGRLRYICAALKLNNPHLPEGHPERLPRLLINRRCTNTIREFSDHRYPETRGESSNANERPLKKDDHTPEALGRFFVGYFDAPANERSRVTTADISNG